MAAIYSNGGNRWNILGFNFTKRDALSSVYKISMIPIDISIKSKRAFSFHLISFQPFYCLGSYDEGPLYPFTICFHVKIFCLFTSHEKLKKFLHVHGKIEAITIHVKIKQNSRIIIGCLP